MNKSQLLIYMGVCIVLPAFTCLAMPRLGKALGPKGGLDALGGAIVFAGIYKIAWIILMAAYVIMLGFWCKWLKTNAVLASMHVGFKLLPFLPVIVILLVAATGKVMDAHHKANYSAEVFAGDAVKWADDVVGQKQETVDGKQAMDVENGLRWATDDYLIPYGYVSSKEEAYRIIEEALPRILEEFQKRPLCLKSASSGKGDEYVAVQIESYSVDSASHVLTVKYDALEESKEYPIEINRDWGE